MQNFMQIPPRGASRQMGKIYFAKKWYHVPITEIDEQARTYCWLHFVHNFELLRRLSIGFFVVY